ncbi:hypothetical protein [Streptomyces sp. NPDC006510]|uniref:hypothetical protein n=1 Tax=Streptomyces sp. NPDC006510 TaxID=3155600 RepID=UPI0033A24E5A
MTTWQGWQHFATTPPPVPPGPGDPARSDEERLAYHSAFVTLRTPAILTEEETTPDQRAYPLTKPSSHGLNQPE